MEALLHKVGITVNKNTVPFDSRSPFVTSGIRIGTPALTSRGMGTAEMEKIADIVAGALVNKDDEDKLAKLFDESRELCSNFPLYPEM